MSADNVVLPPPAVRGSILTGIARASLQSAFGASTDPMPQAEWLFASRASFVTLSLGGALRGCVGSIEAHRPLREDVWTNARAAAFRDPRFLPLKASELTEVRLEVTVLSTLAALEIADEADACAKLRPRVDGVVLTCGGRRGAFLPQVWATLPEPRAFLAHLKRKAGLPEDSWPPTLRLERFTAEEHHEPEERRPSEGWIVR